MNLEDPRRSIKSANIIMAKFNLYLREKNSYEKELVVNKELVGLAFDELCGKLEEMSKDKKKNVSVCTTRGNLIFEILYAPKRPSGVWYVVADYNRYHKFVKSF